MALARPPEEHLGEKTPAVPPPQSEALDDAQAEHLG